MNHILRNTPCNQFIDKNQEYVVVYTTITTNILTCSIIIFTCFILYMTFGAANPSLGYNAQNFHWWQLLTAHFIHYDLKHLSLNMLAFLILLYLFPTKTKALVSGFLLAIISIDIYLYFSDVHYYIGFSGLLYVIPGMALGRFFSDKKYWYAFIIVVVFIAYSLFKQITPMISEQKTWLPLIQSHFLGVVAGLLTQTLTNLNNKIKVSVTL